MEETIAQISVYYRDMPESLEKAISLDAFSKMNKEGVCDYKAHKAIRSTILVSSSGSLQADSRRIEELLRTLNFLHKSLYILGYNINKLKKI